MRNYPYMILLVLLISFNVSADGFTGSKVSGNVSVVGNVTENSVSSNSNIPVLPAKATLNKRSLTEGNLVNLNTDLNGSLRVSNQDPYGTSLLKNFFISALTVGS